MASGKVADVQLDVGEARDRMLSTGRDEPLRDATLIEDLDGARVETAGARSVELLRDAPFDDDDVDVRQRQLASQHQPRRAASRNHHRMFSHRSRQRFEGLRAANESWSARSVACSRPLPRAYRFHGRDRTPDTSSIQTVPSPVRDRKSLGYVLGRFVVPGHRRRRRPAEVVVQHLP